MCLWIDKQRLVERRFADQEILHARDHLVLRAVHPHDFERVARPLADPSADRRLVC
jgi:hypothetical protein